jgi:hypothetical protein
VTLRSTLAAAAASAALLLALAGCSSATPTAGSSSSPTASADGTCAGVTVIVDPGDLKVPASTKKKACVPTGAPISAGEALTKAKVTTEGTKQYGDQVVCRVNGVPSAELDIPAADGSTYHEQCQGMPAAFAYWSLWLKPAGGAWAYAQEGMATQKVEPGQSIELLFALNDKPATPAP